MTDLLRRLTQWTAAWRIALFLSMVAALWLATTKLEYPVQVSSWDKANHLAAFIELIVLTRLAWPRAPLIHSALAMLGFGLLIEIIQAPIPYRSFSLLDLLADGIGIGIGLFIWWHTFRRLSATA